MPWRDLYERAKALAERAKPLLPLLKRYRGKNELLLDRALALCVDSGCLDIVRYHFHKAYDAWGPDGGSPALERLAAKLYMTLCSAIDAGDETIVRFVLEEAAADPQRRDPVIQDTSLQKAVLKGRIAIIQLLLDHGADPKAAEPESTNWPPITLAIAKEQLDIFRLLRERGAVLDTPWSGGSAMQVAKRNGPMSMLDLLVGEGVEEDARPDPRMDREDSLEWY